MKITHVFWRFHYLTTEGVRERGIAATEDGARDFCRALTYVYMDGYWVAEEREEA